MSGDPSTAAAFMRRGSNASHTRVFVATYPESSKDDANRLKTAIFARVGNARVEFRGMADDDFFKAARSCATTCGAPVAAGEAARAEQFRDVLGKYASDKAVVYMVSPETLLDYTRIGQVDKALRDSASGLVAHADDRGRPDGHLVAAMAGGDAARRAADDLARATKAGTAMPRAIARVLKKHAAATVQNVASHASGAAAAAAGGDTSKAAAAGPVFAAIFGGSATGASAA